LHSPERANATPARGGSSQKLPIEVAAAVVSNVDRAGDESDCSPGWFVCAPHSQSTRKCSNGELTITALLDKFDTLLSRPCKISATRMNSQFFE